MTDTTGFLAGALRWLYDDAPPAACPACGYSWATSFDDALARIAAAPERYAHLLDGHDGRAAADDGGWNATAYLWHLTDLARSWTERWVYLSARPGALLAGWDPNELATARNYRNLPTESAVWALTEATATFVRITGEAGPTTPFLHGDWGDGTVGEAVVWLGHEFVHHQLDVATRAVPVVDD